MSKKFIASDIFADPWFMELSRDAKLTFFYLIANCDCAGILKFNEKLYSFQTGIKTWPRVEEELGNRLARLGEDYLILTKYVQFQYPKGLGGQSNAIQAVIKRLSEFDLWDGSNLRVPQELGKSCPRLLDKDKDLDKDLDREKDRGTKARPASQKEVEDFCVELGLCKSDGEACWHKWNGNGFVNGKAKILDWKATIRSWKAAGYMPSQKEQPSGQRQLTERELSRGEFR